MCFIICAGIFVGSTDIAMNALVSNMEKKDSQNFMSAAHGFFSLGGAIGATLGSFLLAIFTKPAYHGSTNKLGENGIKELILFH
jgi:fucose permease